MILNRSSLINIFSSSKILIACLIAALSTNIHADVLSKTALAIKQDFDTQGATACSKQIAEIYDFVTEGNDASFVKNWSNKDPNKRSIAIDFSVYGTKDTFAKTGSIILVPVDGACRGMYFYQQPLSNKKCSAVIKDFDFTPPKWTTEKKESNGDGGEFIILSLKSNPALYFNFIDLPGSGCLLSKRELVTK